MSPAICTDQRSAKRLGAESTFASQWVKALQCLGESVPSGVWRADRNSGLTDPLLKVKREEDRSSQETI